MAKPKNLPSMRPTRARKPAKVATKPYRLLMGTPTQTAMFPEEIETLTQLKSKARKVFADLLPWCAKYPETANRKSLEEAMEKVGEFTGSTSDQVIIEAAFDPHFGLVARVTLWRQG